VVEKPETRRRTGNWNNKTRHRKKSMHMNANETENLVLTESERTYVSNVLNGSELDIESDGASYLNHMAGNEQDFSPGTPFEDEDGFGIAWNLISGLEREVLTACNRGLHRGSDIDADQLRRKIRAMTPECRRRLVEEAAAFWRKQGDAARIARQAFDHSSR